MPKTITKEITLYTFAELVELEGTGSGLDKACQKAREWLQESQTDHDWWDYTYDTWKSALAQIGFDDAEISFSGFWSQRDGASFTCKSVDMEKLIEFLLSDIEPNPVISYDGKTEDFRGWLLHKVGGYPAISKEDLNLLKPYMPNAQAEVDRISSHYCHHNTCRFNLDTGYGDPFDSGMEELANHLEAACERLRVAICHAIHDDLEKEFEWLTEDKQLIDTANNNGYMFNEDGEMETE